MKEGEFISEQVEFEMCLVAVEVAISSHLLSIQSYSIGGKSEQCWRGKNFSLTLLGSVFGDLQIKLKLTEREKQILITYDHVGAYKEM